MFAKIVGPQRAPIIVWHYLMYSMWHGQTCGLKCEILLQVQTCCSFLMILSHVEHFAQKKTHARFVGACCCPIARFQRYEYRVQPATRMSLWPPQPTQITSTFFFWGGAANLDSLNEDSLNEDSCAPINYKQVVQLQVLAMPSPNNIGTCSGGSLRFRCQWIYPAPSQETSQ